MKVALIFPGQGSQHVGMGKDLFESFPEARAVYEEADRVLGYGLSGLSFFGPAEELNRTERTQPALLAAGYAACQVLRAKGVRPDVVAGHSLGEYTASVAAGAMPFGPALVLTELRGRLMQEAVPEGSGLMAAVLGLDNAKVEEVCREVRSGYVAPANYNCPGQIVISGQKAAVEEAIALLKAAGAKRAIPLQVSVPSHCRLMEKAAVKLSEHLFLEADVEDPEVPVVGNADAIFLATADGLRAGLVKQLSSPVRWEESIRVMHGAGVDVFVEAGPGKVLSGLVKRILPQAVVLNVEDAESLGKTLSELANLSR